MRDQLGVVDDLAFRIACDGRLLALVDPFPNAIPQP
jgi:hypothetical protein